MIACMKLDWFFFFAVAFPKKILLPFTISACLCSSMSTGAWSVNCTNPKPFIFPSC